MPSNSLVAEPIIDASRMAWRKSLNEQSCRELAAEYEAALSRAKKAGTPEQIDECLFDAHEEYMARYFDADQQLGQNVRKTKSKAQLKNRRAPKRRDSLYK